MAAIDAVMKRLGFVRLHRYGLVLTPEGRIISLRPAVLDDGLGARVVGWQDDDLAAAQLEAWAPPPAAQRAVASRVAISVSEPSPAVEIRTIPVPPAPQVARGPQVEEDEWEWEIALARARAAAEDSEAAASTTPTRTTRPMLATKIEPIESWPKTEPLGAIDYEDYSSATREIVRVTRGTEPPPTPASKVVRVPTPPPVRAKPVTISQPAIAAKPVTISQPAIAARPVVTPRAGSPMTIIPVPKLATVANSQSLAPVVRSAAPLPSIPRRLAKGTGPVDSAPVARPVAALAPKPPVVAPNPPAGRSKLPSIVQRAR